MSKTVEMEGEAVDAEAEAMDANRQTVDMTGRAIEVDVVVNGPAERAGQTSVDLDGGVHAAVLDGIQVALGSVADLESAPVADHPARLQAVHGVLQDALADVRPSS